MNFKEQIMKTEARVNVYEFIEKSSDWQKHETMERVLFRLNSLKLDDMIVESMEANTDSQPNILERIIKANELMNVTFLYKGASVARTVGRVIIRQPSGRIIGYGTGFMVSPQLLLTNNHVLESKLDAQHSLIEFNFRENYFGQLTESIKFKLKPDDFFYANEHLDFSLVAVEKKNIHGNLLLEQGWNQLIKTSGKAIVGEHVNIIQHPAAEPKQIVIRQNTIKALKDSFIHYITDTEIGSSGSPVYNDQWEVVALHHAGVPKRDSNGNILLIDGRVWNGNRSEQDHIAWTANEGVRISEILKYLDSQHMSQSEKMIYNEIYSASPSKSEMVKNTNINQGPIHEPDGSTSWYFRLNFGPVSDQQKITSDTDKKFETPQKQPYADNAHAVVNAAISEEKPYYDSVTDALNREKYYSTIDFGQSPQELFKSLSIHLKNTHNKILSYKQARWQYLYPIVDRREGGYLRNIYSGSTIDPVEAIRREMILIEEHQEVFLEQLESQNIVKEIDKEDALDLLEAQLAFNCEHVVPQSWFDKKQPMRSDLHHLFACDPKCNSFRGNIPYFQFSAMDEVTQYQCGRREGNKFEPEIGHGAVARATFYFLLRYPGIIGDETRELQKNRLKILINWHHQYPVDRYELHRNETIFSAQGNRNPLIDFPELIDKIDLEKGFGD